MNKFMDLEEVRQPLLSFGISPFARHWEYPWAIINSKIRKGDNVLDAGCGNSPLLLYLHKFD